MSLLSGVNLLYGYAPGAAAPQLLHTNGKNHLAVWRPIVYGVAAGGIPGGTDGDVKTNADASPAPADFDVRDALLHTIAIPVAEAGFRGISLAHRGAVFDQSVTASLYWYNGPAVNKANAGHGLLWQGALSNIAAWGLGAVQGGLPASSVYHAVDALAYAQRWLAITLQAGTAPTAGTFSLTYWRWY